MNDTGMYVFLFQFTSLLCGRGHHVAIVVKIHGDLKNAIFLSILAHVWTNFARSARNFFALCLLIIIQIPIA